MNNCTGIDQEIREAYRMLSPAGKEEFLQYALAIALEYGIDMSGVLKRRKVEGVQS